jgi:cell division protein FtsQ
MPELKNTADKRTQKPKKRRKSNMMIYYIMFLFIFIIVFSVLSVTVLFNLDEIIVEGESIYDYDEIAEAAGIRTGVNLLRLDTARPRNRLVESLVYIDDARIRKNFPGRLTIHVTGAVEMANIEHGGRYYTVSKNGRILSEADIITSNIIIYGYEADEPVIGRYISTQNERKRHLIFTLVNTMEEAELTGIVSIDISDHLDITMNYMNRVEILLGTEFELDIKLKAAAEMTQHRINVNESGVLRLIDPLAAIVFLPEVPEAAIRPDDIIADDDDDGDNEPEE